MGRKHKLEKNELAKKEQYNFINKEKALKK